MGKTPDAAEPPCPHEGRQAPSSGGMGHQTSEEGRNPASLGTAVESGSSTADQHVPPRSLPLLTVAALGVVYGDIGTSPLYAIRECFFGSHAVPPTTANVLGVLSLIVYSLVLVVSLKYIAIVMRASEFLQMSAFVLLTDRDERHVCDRFGATTLSSPVTNPMKGGAGVSAVGSSAVRRLVQSTRLD